MNRLYENQLNDYLTKPDSFQGSPGFQWAFDQGMRGVQRANSSTRNSGNILAELQRFGTGLASQDYGQMLDRLTKLSGQEQSYDLGQGQNANAADRNANDFNLGVFSNNNTAQRDWWNYDLGKEQNAQNAANAQNNWNLKTGGKTSYSPQTQTQIAWRY